MLLNADFFARYPGAKTLCNLRLRSQILADRDPNVFQRLLACRALAVAARKVIAPNGESFFGLHERHVIFHRLKVQHSKNILKFFLLTGLGFSVREAGSFSLIHSKPRRKRPAGRFGSRGESVSLVGASPLRRSGWRRWTILSR